MTHGAPRPSGGWSGAARKRRKAQPDWAAAGVAIRARPLKLSPGAGGEGEERKLESLSHSLYYVKNVRVLQTFFLLNDLTTNAFTPVLTGLSGILSLTSIFCYLLPNKKSGSPQQLHFSRCGPSREGARP